MVAVVLAMLALAAVVAAKSNIMAVHMMAELASVMVTSQASSASDPSVALAGGLSSADEAEAEAQDSSAAPDSAGEISYAAEAEAPSEA